LAKKTTNEKRDTPKTQGAKKKRPPMKKDALLKCNGLRKKRPPMKKRHF
jgi:hypothetical protein